MNYEDFKNEVAGRIRDFLPEKYADADISIHPVVKNNDQKLDGLKILLEDSNIAPNIYLEQFFAEHEKGVPMDDILAEIADIRVNNELSHQFDVNGLTDYDSVKDKITCRLVNAEQNKEFLADKPHTLMQDLAVTYHVSIGKHGNGTMSAPVTNALMEKYGVDRDELHRAALENMDTISPASFRSMSDTMADIMIPDMVRSGMGEDEAREAIKSMFPPEQDEMMFVLTNKDKFHGAAALLDDKVMDEVTEKLGRDFYILPSSVHEVIIVAGDALSDIKELESMVRDINDKEVSPGERLSDHVYAYDAKTHELYRADQAQDRALADEEKALKDSSSLENESAGRAADGSLPDRPSDNKRPGVSSEHKQDEKHSESKRSERPVENKLASRHSNNKERASLKAKLAQKKDIIAKADAGKVVNNIRKNRGEQAMA